MPMAIPSRLESPADVYGIPANSGVFFIHTPDVRELSDRLPILQTPADEDPLRNYLIAMSDISTIDFEGKNRNNRRKINATKIGASVFKLNFAVSKHLYTTGDSLGMAYGQAQEAILEAVQKSPFVLPDRLMSVMCEMDIEKSEEFFPLLNWVNKESAKVQESLAVNSPQDAYEYIKSLWLIEPDFLKSPRALTSNDDEVLWRYGMLALTGKADAVQPYYKSVELLRSGAIDPLIAADLISVIAGRDMASVPEQLVPLSSFVKFIEHVSGFTLDKDGRDRLASSLLGWPKEHQAIVKVLRADAETKLFDLKQIADTACDGIVLEQGRSYTDEIQQSVLNVVRETNYRGQWPRKIGGGLINAAQRPPKRKVTIKPQEVLDLPQQMPERQPLTLKSIDTNGDIHEAGSTQYNKVISDYLDTYRGMPQIEEDVKILLEHLQQLDLSQLHACIKKVKTPTIVPMHEFRPSLAAGLNVNNDWAKRTRIVFSFAGDNTLALAAIVHREKLDQALKPFKK
jgi:hypothetical protein